MLEEEIYSMPAEWEEHERTFIQWPVREALITPENYEEVCAGYAEVANAIAEFEPVSLLVCPGDETKARALCSEGVELLPIPHNDGWVRDNGPTFVRNAHQKLAGIHWGFNAWGGKYQPCDLDRAAATAILSHFRVPCAEAPFVLEGGSIHTDGEGTLLTTRQCLLNPNRNPSLSQENIEAYLKKYLNIQKILWLDQGLFGDETDGHVDNLACFARPGVILLQTCSDRTDPNFAVSQENLQILAQSLDAQNRTLQTVEIPQPPKRLYKGSRLTLSYLNFYFVNGGIILPVFGGDAKKTDERAEEILHSLFPKRRIRTVDGMKLIKEGGNVHCITQQMPCGLHG